MQSIHDNIGCGRTSLPIVWLTGHSNIIWDVNSNTIGKLITANQYVKQN